MILSGTSGISRLPEAFTVTHQYLPKPCEANALVTAVTMASELRDQLGNDALERVINEIKSVPCHPEILRGLKPIINGQNAPLSEIGEQILGDMGMTLKLLQLINSDFFVYKTMITDPFKACNLLEQDIIEYLVEMTDAIPTLALEILMSEDGIDLWKHSYQVGKIAQAISVAENCAEDSQKEIYLAGFLHDIGKIILAVNLPAEYTKTLSLAKDQGISQIVAERRVFGASHADIGAYLMSLWGLPRSLAILVKCHHEPSRCQDRQQMIPTAIVHAANGLAQLTATNRRDEMDAYTDEEFLKRMNLADHYSTWLEIAQSLSEK